MGAQDDRAARDASVTTTVNAVRRSTGDTVAAASAEPASQQASDLGGSAAPALSGASQVDSTADGGAVSPGGSAAFGRRGFVLGCAGGAAMLALGLVKFAPQTALCRPPGGQDESRLLGMCVRCGKCMEVCPTGVIAPAHIEDGVVGVRTPRLSYSRSKAQLGSLAGWCDHCNAANGGAPRCAAVCPSGALDATAGTTFESMRLGVAAINRDWCLAWRLKGCTICLNACPVGAISFDDHNRPLVDQALCNGCGACEQACVSLESTSIGQDENNKHMTARAITVQALER